MALALLSSSLRSARAHARDWAECALNLAFPWAEFQEAEPVPIERPFCEQCGFPHPALKTHEATYVCNDCTQQTWHFEWARAAYMTKGQVREAVVGFKYRDQYYQQMWLTQWLTEAFGRHFQSGRWDALVPVPLYHRRHRERGFNQANELARALASSREIPDVDCLYRYRETAPQATLDRSARWKNMAGAFQMKQGFDVGGRNLLLIDDVFTTGATVNACAQVLAEAGAGQLAVLTVARS